MNFVKGEKCRAFNWREVAVEELLQGRTPAGSGWKAGVDGKALTDAFVARQGGLVPSPTR
ncbi:hypothetical protein [Nonomuraea solani]|uniref:hypothetical protein n=1 Tax=Nonomuraea solani TaxID=1144553 RepID=UPI0011AFD761|nr:hypothetical protein [Nonomuraea solani]